MAKSSLVSETVMYSVNTKGKGEVVVHHLPYPRDSVMLETYLQRGFTFERPQGVLTQPIVGSTISGAEVKIEENPLQCQCGFVAKSEFGLSVHQRRHKK